PVCRAHILPPPRPDRFPYTTLFRSQAAAVVEVIKGPAEGVADPTKQVLGQILADQQFEAADVAEAGVVEALGDDRGAGPGVDQEDRKSTRLNSSHVKISYAVFCLKK